MRSETTVNGFLGSSTLTGVPHIIHDPGFGIFTKMAGSWKCTAPADAIEATPLKSNRIILQSLTDQFSDKIVRSGFENANKSQASQSSATALSACEVPIPLTAQTHSDKNLPQYLLKGARTIRIIGPGACR